MSRPSSALRVTGQQRRVRSMLRAAGVLPTVPAPLADPRPAAVQRAAIEESRANGVEPGLAAEQELVAAEQRETQQAKDAAEVQRSRAAVSAIRDGQRAALAGHAARVVEALHRRK